ncbi:MAG: glycosyl transferase, partial [Thermodesulfobacteriota bacterium]
MNICYYCQHVLGVGHFYRSLEICKALAVEHRVTMITGGPEVPCHAEEIDFFKLPGLQMDSVFSRLISCDSRRPVDDVKEERIRILLDLFSTTVFDAFIVELYPFGRKG